MGATATHAYRHEALSDGTVTLSLTRPMPRGDDRLVGFMIEALREVSAVPDGTDLAASAKQAEAANSWRFNDEHFAYWVLPPAVASEQVERLSLRRYRSS
jgi:hypothetical protein